MTDVDGLKKIAVIVPSSESMAYYDTFFNSYEGFTFLKYNSLDQFNKDLIRIGGCDGFIIDLRAILKSDTEEKEYINYMLELFPSIRVTHTPDKRSVTGYVKGRTLRDGNLFDFFFGRLFPALEGRSVGRIALIVKEKADHDLYESFMADYNDFELIHFPSALAFKESLTPDSRFNGMIVDLRTMMKSSPEEKDFLHELLDSFPAMRISLSSDRKIVKGNVTDKNLQGKELFDYFMKDLCRHFNARGIRLQKRKGLFLNVHLDLSKNGNQPQTELSKNAIRANTVDVSELGGFILGVLDVEFGDKVKLVINELQDRSPIEGIVKWHLPWGQSARHLPGCGVRFIRLTADQKNELSALLNKK